MISTSHRRTFASMRRNTSVKVHKYPVGACVFHRAGIPGVEGAIFRVTRLLPDGGEGLQYRLKGENDGQERVSAEGALRPIGSPPPLQ